MAKRNGQEDDSTTSFPNSSIPWTSPQAQSGLGHFLSKAPPCTTARRTSRRDYHYHPSSPCGREEVEGCRERRENKSWTQNLTVPPTPRLSRGRRGSCNPFSHPMQAKQRGCRPGRTGPPSSSSCFWGYTQGNRRNEGAETKGRILGQIWHRLSLEVPCEKSGTAKATCPPPPTTSD